MPQQNFVPWADDELSFGTAPFERENLETLLLVSFLFLKEPLETKRLMFQACIWLFYLYVVLIKLTGYLHKLLMYC